MKRLFFLPGLDAAWPTEINMKILSPDNIYVQMLLSAIPKDKGHIIDFMHSSLIAPELYNEAADIAIIPSCDLIKYKDLLVSRDVAIVFDGLLSNSYFYFPEGQNTVKKLNLAGDISLNEIILSKILFRERYSEEVEICLTVSSEDYKDKNFLIAGKDNYLKLAPKDSAGMFDGSLFTGLSFGDEISTMLFMPYVNFVVASKSEEKLKEFSRLTKNADEYVEASLSDPKDDPLYSDSGLTDFINGNYDSLFFRMSNIENDALEELLRLPYYHGISEEPFEIKFV